MSKQQQLAYYFFFATIKDDKKQEFINLFYEKDTINNDENEKRTLGNWKNKITYISPDFNEPLEELSDYM